MYSELWNNPDVMRNVGFPRGLRISREKIMNKIQGYDESVFDKTLVVLNKKTLEKMGECKLGFPNKDLIASTDIKLLPRFWKKGYGKEIKNALCKYLFQHTKTKIIEASPNVKNEASQRMQEACGGKKVKDGIYHFPPEMQHYTEDVHCIIYHIQKKDWLKKHLEIKEIKVAEDKSKICADVILALPKWFGIPESNKEYIEGVKRTTFYTAFMFGKPVGFYSIISHFPETSEIYVCGILEDFHRLGIGIELQKKVEKILSIEHVKYLTVKTLSSSHSDNNYARTREFYKACGFIPLEEFKTLWGESNPCLFLVKKIY